MHGFEQKFLNEMDNKLWQYAEKWCVCIEPTDMPGSMETLCEKIKMPVETRDRLLFKLLPVEIYFSLFADQVVGE